MGLPGIRLLDANFERSTRAEKGLPAYTFNQLSAHEASLADDSFIPPEQVASSIDIDSLV